MGESMSNQEIKKLYFIEYWREFTRYAEDKINQLSCFNNLEQDSINPILYNPKELFKEFIDEIERKNLSNSDNKNFFIENVKNLIKLDIEALKFLKSTLTIIQRQFSKKDDFSYLLYALKFALNEMDNFRLGKECVKGLAEILLDNQSLDNSKETIKHLVNFIVFELKYKGFSDKKIYKIVNEIFDIYHEDKHDTSFPHNLEFPKELTQRNLDKFYQNLKTCMDSLTVRGRIISLGNYFDRETFPIRFIFRINGIRGKENLKIGDIEIYNPLEKQLIDKKDSDCDKIFDETFGLRDSEKASLKEICNIAVRVNVIERNDEESGKNEAINKAHAFFNCFVSSIFYIKTKISLDITQYIVLNDKNIPINRHFNNIDEKASSYQNAECICDFIQNMDSNHLKYYENLIKQKEAIAIDKKIVESLAWKKRALESTNYNEAILWHWISIENLFSSKNETTKLIFHFAPKILVNTYIYHFIQQIRHWIRCKTFPFSNYNISKDAIKFIQNIQKNITYKEFENTRFYKNF